MRVPWRLYTRNTKARIPPQRNGKVLRAQTSSRCGDDCLGAVCLLSTNVIVTFIRIIFVRDGALRESEN